MNKRILFISVMIFLLGAAIVSTFLSAIMPAESTGPFQALSEAHEKLVIIEAKISEIKPICAELDSLRLQRDELVNKTNEIINSTGSSFKKEQSSPKTATPPKNEEKSQIVEILDTDLAKSINSFWANSILEGKGQLLVDECKASTVPDLCAKIIAAQTKIETNFGTAGTGRDHLKNLTGIRDSGKWRKYEKYDDSIKDTVKLFINGNYQDYFTIYGYDSGVCKHLARWGTNHCTEVKEIIATL